MTETSAVQVVGLGRRFGAVVAVDDLTFTVAPGELFGLLGPDGAGKTTTLRMLAGVLRPTSGDAFINGVSVVKNPEATKHQIAYMSQRFGLYGDLTVLENLTFYADLYEVPYHERPARMERLFHFSNLGPFQHRLAGKLSGGMKQKLGLSCALIHQPQVLLLDEPTFGVDPISRRDLWLIVHDMVAQGVTVVVSTAYMDEAERFDRLAVLHQGRLLALDFPSALQEARHGEVLAVQVDRPRAARDLALQLPSVRRAAIFGDRLHVTLRDRGEDAEHLRSTLTSGGMTVTGIDPIVPSMEDVFIALVAEGNAA